MHKPRKCEMMKTLSLLTFLTSVFSTVQNGMDCSSRINFSGLEVRTL